MTKDEAQQLMEKRFAEYPLFGAIAKGEGFQDTLNQILVFAGVDSQLYGLVENEVLVILSLYAPLSTLPQNISQTTGLPIETSAKIATLIETLVFAPIIDDLLAYDALWQKEVATTSTLPEANLETKERLELRPRPDATPTPAGTAPTTNAGAQPLTREELMNALAGKRTMAQDIEAVRMKREAAKVTTPPPPAPPTQS